MPRKQIFDPPLPYAEIDRVYQFMAWIMAELGISHWRIQVTEAPAPRDAYAQIEPIDGKYLGELSLGPDWMARDLEEERIQTLIHEALHLTHADLTHHVTDRFYAYVGHQTYSQLEPEWKRSIELWVDHMTQVIRRLLKPAIEAKAAEIWGDDWREQGDTTASQKESPS